MIGTKFFNSNDLRNNGNLLSEVKRKLYDAENTLRKVMEKPAFSDFLQKLKEANATREENNSQNQINVLDSSDNLGIMETKESVENAVPQNSEAVAPVNIKLKFMQKWTPEQRQQAIEKLKALSLAKTVKQAGKAKNRSKRQLYKTSYGENSIPESYDVDHIVDIQLGGDPNSIDNLQVLDRSVNRSLGAQIMHAIKNYPPGTVFGTFTIE